MFVDSLILRKLFVYLFWIYYIEKFQSNYPFVKGDDIPENVANELRVSLKKKLLKLYTIIP